jgi:hypothetical protein
VDEPIQVIIHIYMEMSKGNTLYSFTKTENREAKQVLSGVWHQWEEVRYKERVQGV